MSDQTALLSFAEEGDVRMLAARLASLALEQLAPAERTVALRCVAPHWFEARFVLASAAELGVDDPVTLHEQILALPFIESLAGGRLAYHDTTRRGLLRQLSDEEPEVLRDGARVAARLLNDAPDPAASVERVHCLRVAGDPAQALQLQDALFERAAADTDWQLYDALARLEAETEEELAFVMPLLSRKTAIVCGSADEQRARELVDGGFVEGPVVLAGETSVLVELFAETRKTLLLLSPATAPAEREAIDAALVQLAGPETIARRVVPLVAGSPVRPQAIEGLAEIALTDSERDSWTHQLLVALGNAPAASEDEEADVPPGWRMAHPPPAISGFIGRERELAELNDWFCSPEPRTLVLRGMGGAGKTSLTWRWLTAMHARGLAPRELIWWSFYEGDADFGRCLTYALDALGVAGAPGATVELLASALHDRDVLVVLDGFERVAEGADAAARLLRLAAAGELGGGRLLVTTRQALDETLGVDGEQASGTRVVRVGPMVASDALALLRRAGVRGDERCLNEIVDRYDAHALSLRLVAGLVRDDPQRPGDPQVERRLDVHGSVVQRRSHVVEHAYEALTADERALLARIARIDGDFSREEAAWATGEQVTDPAFVHALATLNRRGLLEATTATGQLELHPVVRGYALSRLAPTERTAAEQRLAEGYRARLDDDPGDEQARARLEHHLVALHDHDGLVELTTASIVGLVRATHTLDAAALVAVEAATRSVLRGLIEHAGVDLPLIVSPAFREAFARVIPGAIDGQVLPDAGRVAQTLIDAQPLERRDSRALESLAADFVDETMRLAREHAAEHAEPDVERVAEAAAPDTQALRAALNPASATPGTRRDYLSWVHERYAHDVVTGAAIEDIAVPLPIVPVGGAEGALRGADAAYELHQRILLVGAAGAGKSFLLRRLARRQAEAALAVDSVLPLLVSLRDCGGGPLELFLIQSPRREGCDVSGLSDLLERALLRSGALLLLDGLDELSVERQARVAHDLLDLLARHPHLRVVLATRPFAAARQVLADAFETYEFAPLEADLASELINRVVALNGHESSPERALASLRRFGAHLRSPLALALIGMLYARSGTLPRSVPELYASFVRMIEETGRASDLIDDPSARTRILGRVAYRLTSKPWSSLDEAELREIVDQDFVEQWAPTTSFDIFAKSSSEALTATLRRGDALFCEVAPDRYGFPLRGVQEYFAALHLIGRRRDAAREIRQHLHDPIWDEVLRLALARIGLDDAQDATDLLMTAVLAAGESARTLGFVPSAHEHALGRDLLFATECVARDVPVTPGVATWLGGVSARLLLERRAAARFGEPRRRLLAAAATTADERMRVGFQLLMLEAVNGETEWRIAAVECLARVGGDVPGLAERLREALADRDDRMRIVAATALLASGAAETPRDAALVVLLDELRGGLAPSRCAALVALAWVPRLPKPVEELLPWVLRDLDPAVTRAAIALVGHVEHPRPELLETLLARGADAEKGAVRPAVAAAFAGFSDRAQVQGFLARCALDGSADARGFAVELLGVIGGESRVARRALHEALDWPATRREAVMALSDLGEPSPMLLEHIGSLLDDPDVSARRVAIAAAAQLATYAVDVAEDALAPVGVAAGDLRALIRRALDDPDPVVRLGSATALLRRDPDMSAAERLAELARVGPLAVRLDAIAGLVELRLGVDAPGAIVDEALVDGDTDVRTRAIELGGRVWEASERHVQQLGAVLRDDPDPGPRRAAAAALVELAHRWPALRLNAEQTLVGFLERHPEGPRCELDVATDPGAVTAAAVADAAWSALHALATPGVR